jgi:hypothetical protein
VALVCGCSDVQAPRESAARAETPAGEQGASLVRALGARFVRAEHPFLPASRPEALVRGQAGWRAEFARLPSSAARRADVTVPHRAAGALAVIDAESGLSLRAELAGATDSEGVADRGYVVYRGGHETGADVLIRPDAEGAEDYLHWASRPARESITYRVGLGGVAGLRLVARTLELLDGGGAPRLRMAPPVGLDARGNEVRPEVEVSGCAFDSDPAAPWGRAVISPGASSCEVTLRWGLEAEAYPLLLDPGWSTTGSMATGRSLHVAVVLDSSKVLVAGGGLNDGTIHKTAELFNPATGTWAATGSMANIRQMAGGVKLTDGRVLVAGGANAFNNGPTAAEVYNPATGTWAAAGALAASRWAYPLLLLSSGEVLAVGGRTAGNTLAGSRNTHTASLLQDGRVLVVVGVVVGTSLKTAEVFSLGVNGQSCSLAGQCSSRNCAASICCDTSCSAASTACIQSLTGKPDGTCGPIANGATCSSGSTCGSGFCVDGFCCGSACAAPLACSQARTGKPNGQCGPLVNGLSCSNDTACISGFCTDGVCCSARCNGLCESCLQVHTGVTQGVCAPIPNDSDPQGECDPAGSGVCALQGVCNGQRSCKNVQGTSCALSTCVNGTYTPPSFCNAAGTCSVPASSTCGQYACLDATQCRTSCTDDAHCAAGTQCIGGTCGPGKGNGASCSQNDECSSKYCTDGLCCSSACNDACFSCKGAETGDTNGACLPVKAGTDPGNECAASGTDCGSDGFCDGKGACSGNATAGLSCGASTCAGLGVQSLLCDGKGACATVTSPPCPGGYVCQSGQCLTSCVDDSHCSLSSYCAAGSCKPKQANGAPCSQSDQCSSDSCTEGVCCDSACTSPCQSCVGLNTQSGVNGKCDSVKDGTDPKNACDKDPADLCGADGLCGNDGLCRPFAPVSAACGKTLCAGAAAVSGLLCDGAGVCKAADATPCVDGFVCAAGACLTACGADADCVSGRFCDKGKCALPQGNGAACKADGQCESGHCVDDLCCDTLCDGACQSCRGVNTISGVDGACGDVKGGTDPRSMCPADDQNPCGADGSCGPDGQCSKVVAKDTPCGSDSCVAESLVARVCDGFGMCKNKTKQACSPYACDDNAGSCKAKCLTNADCAAGTECNSAKQECAISGSTCVDQFTVQSSTGQKTSCAPYSCLNGVCKTSCANDGECASGFACSSGACIPSVGAGGAAGSTGAAGSPAGGSSAGGSPAGGSPAGGSPAGGQGQGAGGTSVGDSSGAGGALAGAPPSPTNGDAEQSGGCALPRRLPSSPDSALWLGALAAAAVARRKRAHKPGCRALTRPGD